MLEPGGFLFMSGKWTGRRALGPDREKLRALSWMPVERHFILARDPEPKVDDFLIERGSSAVKRFRRTRTLHDVA